MLTMTNAQLIAAIRSGRATDGERREYSCRVARRANADPCEHGHMDCALIEGGPCENEVAAGLSDWDE